MGSRDAQQDELIRTREALEIIGYADPSSIAKFVKDGRLKPAVKLAGLRGAYVFNRSDVERLAAELASVKS